MMTPTSQGSIRLIRVAGIDIHVHWSWFLAAAYEISDRKQHYSSLSWNAWEYLMLFGIVLLHELGHAFACRQVGGQANQVVLWPLGGVAYVAPPQRPGATLWSIAAGPLVNVILVPVFLGLVYLEGSLNLGDAQPDLHRLLHAVSSINLGLLIFNLLPIYPLDGGQILRSLLWYGLGSARSLVVAASVGFLGVAGLIGLAAWVRSPWLGVMAGFILLNCWSGFKAGRAMARIAVLPRRAGVACPDCHAAPPEGDLWVCGNCKKSFDIFAQHGLCPHCPAQYQLARCLECGNLNRLENWTASSSVSPSPP